MWKRTAGKAEASRGAVQRSPRSVRIRKRATREKLDIQRAVHVGVEEGEREAREGDAFLKRRFIQSVVPSRALPGV
jgi:hypothetical protein